MWMKTDIHKTGTKDVYTYEKCNNCILQAKWSIFQSHKQHICLSKTLHRSTWTCLDTCEIKVKHRATLFTTCCKSFLWRQRFYQQQQHLKPYQYKINEQNRRWSYNTSEKETKYSATGVRSSWKACIICSCNIICICCKSKKYIK